MNCILSIWIHVIECTFFSMKIKGHVRSTEVKFWNAINMITLEASLYEFHAWCVERYLSKFKKAIVFRGGQKFIWVQQRWKPCKPLLLLSWKDSWSNCMKVHLSTTTPLLSVEVIWGQQRLKPESLENMTIIYTVCVLMNKLQPYHQQQVTMYIFMFGVPCCLFLVWKNGRERVAEVLISIQMQLLTYFSRDSDSLATYSN